MLRDQESRSEMPYTGRIPLRRNNVIESIVLFVHQVAKAKAFATRKTSTTGYHVQKTARKKIFTKVRHPTVPTPEVRSTSRDTTRETPSQPFSITV